MADEEKKIFVDEGWKAQVQREKEEAARKAEPAAQEADSAEVPHAPQSALDETGADVPEDLPDASFLALVGSLATQAMLALGIIAPQGSKQVYVDLVQAKYLVDTLVMLRSKTEGNLTDEEAGELTQAVAELQQIYVARAQQIQEAELRQAGVDITNLKGEPK